ncbi:DNA glycosylase [Microthyrium microscopicum]|uniref:DNA glycosylase n=1 Tax=Microthyrium microscopicum TaxID=703497 RepID=A0A6A6UBR1_9PEZI|nr:DNA glycosylase [Microthyrium microscopicum]
MAPKRRTAIDTSPATKRAKTTAPARRSARIIASTQSSTLDFKVVRSTDLIAGTGVKPVSDDEDIKPTSSATVPSANAPATQVDLSVEIEMEETATPRSKAGKIKKERKIRVKVEEEILHPGLTATKKRPKWHTTSPWPDHESPSAAQCGEVVHLLAALHGDKPPPKAMPPPEMDRAGCGENHAVHDALLRTLLSANTSEGNAAKAVKKMVKIYGVAETGCGKHSLNWQAVHDGSVEKLEDAINQGGIYKIKAACIKNILSCVVSENKERYAKLLSEGKELDEDDHDPLSLQHLKQLMTPEAFAELVRYHGIGSKTAACVLMFCFQRALFPVDTHVARLSHWLGWTPPDKPKDADKTMWHCHTKIPEHLRYRLHQLFYFHGQECYRCAADTKIGSPAWKACVCPIEHLLNRRKEPEMLKGQSLITSMIKKAKTEVVEAEDSIAASISETVVRSEVLHEVDAEPSALNGSLEQSSKGMDIGMSSL